MNATKFPPLKAALLNTHAAAAECYENAMSRASNRSTIQPKEDPHHGKS
jgi:hypothetical protein